MQRRARAPIRSPRWDSVWPVGLLLLGFASAAWPVLGLPAAFFSFIGVLALPPKSGRDARLARWLVGGAVLASSIGAVRFVVVDAMPGIVGGGRQAVEQRAVSRLREVLFAEDAMRRSGWIDPDGDGIGSAAFLSELCDGPPLRGQPAQPTPVLSCGELVDSTLGPAARSGAYLYVVCLPSLNGGWSAQPSVTVDEEKAERRFVAYAWPDAGSGFDHIFFMDQHERISSAVLPASDSEERARMLSCEGALDAQSHSRWSPWRGKKPRLTLPGDTSSQPKQPEP